MSKPVLFTTDSKNCYRVVIRALPDWEGFDKLIQYLEVHYTLQVIKKYDGPGARRWLLDIDGCGFELIHDDGYGNYFIPSGEGSKKLIDHIGADLEKRLSNL